MRARSLDAAAVWERLPADQRARLRALVDDPRRAAQLATLLDNIAATINEIEGHAAAGERLDEDRDT